MYVIILNMNNNELYLKILDQFPNPIWRAGLDAKCNFFNKNWLEFTGRTMEQEMGDGWVEGVHPDDLKDCVDQYLAHFKEKKSFKLKYRLKHNDGTYHWLLDFGSPFFDENNNFLGYIGSCYDINDSEKAKKQEKLMNTILEKSPIGYAVNKIDSQEFLFVSEKFKEVYGIPGEQLKNVDEFFQKVYKDEKYREEIKKIVMSSIESKDPEKMKWMDVDIKLDSGVEKTISAENIPIYDQNLMISTVQDVTARKKLEKEVSQKLEELEKMNKLMVGRELNMVDLKQKISKLEKKISEK